MIADDVSREVCMANWFLYDLVRHLTVASFIAPVLGKKASRYPKNSDPSSPLHRFNRHWWAIKSKTHLNHAEPCHLISPTLPKFSPLDKSETSWVYIILCSDDQWPYLRYPNINKPFSNIFQVERPSTSATAVKEPQSYYLLSCTLHNLTKLLMPLTYHDLLFGAVFLVHSRDRDICGYVVSTNLLQLRYITFLGFIDEGSQVVSKQSCTMCQNVRTVGGFNPSENISQIGSFPQVRVKVLL